MDTINRTEAELHEAWRAVQAELAEELTDLSWAYGSTGGNVMCWVGTGVVAGSAVEVTVGTATEYLGADVTVFTGPELGEGDYSATYVVGDDIPAPLRTMGELCRRIRARYRVLAELRAASTVISDWRAVRDDLYDTALDDPALSAADVALFAGVSRQAAAKRREARAELVDERDGVY